MKDVPALLVAFLAHKEGGRCFKDAFRRVVTNGKMLRNVIQVCRAGTFGGTSIPRCLRRMAVRWLNRATDQQLLAGSVGQKPSLGDVIKMVHPRPNSAHEAQFFRYLIGKEIEGPVTVGILKRLFEARRVLDRVHPETFNLDVRGIPFQLLTDNLNPAGWKALALAGGYRFVIKNLNTFQRHSVLEDERVVKHLANKISDPDEIRKVGVMPYELFAAYKFSHGIPRRIVNALHRAVECSLANVPVFEGRAVILLDVSGSMQSPVTGQHGSRTATKVECRDVAALFAAAFLKRNPDTIVLPYGMEVLEDVKLEPEDTLMTIARTLGALDGGGTATGHALAYVNRHKIRADAVIILSDEESWADSRYANFYGQQYPQLGVPLMEEWRKFRRSNKEARLVCVDLAPETSSQGRPGSNVLNIGGFNDSYWRLIDLFLKNGLTGARFADIIEAST
jgi:60 kDa SS-A/Ro ribonucleoprotein